MPKKEYSIRVGFVLIVVCSLFAEGVSRAAQTSVKFDEYGDLPSDAEAAHLDQFADGLLKQSTLKGRIIAYSEPRVERGIYLRKIYGIGKYLTQMRGIDVDRVTVVDGGYKDRFTTELWLIPEGANPPLAVSKLAPPSVSMSAAYKFDEECFNCSPAVDLYLYGLDEGLKFYAEVLQRSRGARGVFVVRPDQHITARTARKEAFKARGLLIRSYGIKAERLTVKTAASRNDGTAGVEMWVVPSGARVPVASSNKRRQRIRR